LEYRWEFASQKQSGALSERDEIMLLSWCT